MAFKDALKSKDFTILAEMETPKGVDISDFVESARHIKGRLDAVVIPDMSFAVMRLSALAGAVVLKAQGLEAIVQLSCRDRNRLALQGDLLAAHVQGVPNVLAADGEAVAMGDQLAAQPVYDLDAAGVMEACAALNGGKDLGGMELKGSPELVMGVRLAPWKDEAEMAVVVGKAEAAVNKGASYLVAPAVFDVEAFKAFMAKVGGLGVPVIASVLLLKSVGMARYLNQNLPGMNVSEDTIRRIRQASDRAAECVKIAAETVTALKGVCQGALVVTAGWEDRLPQILDAVR